MATDVLMMYSVHIARAFNWNEARKKKSGILLFVSFALYHPCNYNQVEQRKCLLSIDEK